MNASEYQVIIGLEIHVQLQTQSKLFCGCSTKFGSAPNTQTCHVCTGQPGALPVLNRRALELAIKTGLALDCQIERETKWDRKNYFYPDLPKGYQISQFDRPICFQGKLELMDSDRNPTGKFVRIERAHLEEDAGKSNHDESGQGGDSRIDLNRAGTPLLEIVTKPDLTCADDARDFLNELKLILTFVEVSDCNMQQGNLLVDANVNVMIDAKKEIATPIVEIKNLNSFRAVERAIEFEIQRQIKQYKDTGATKNDSPKQTRGWDDVSQKTTLQREKEDSADYRYFPDPDLLAIKTPESTIERLQSEIGLLPADYRKQLVDSGLSNYDADVLVRQGKPLLNYFEAVVEQFGNPKQVCNWITQEVLRHLNESETSIEEFTVTTQQFAKLLTEVSDKKIDQSRAKDVLAEMIESSIDVDSAKEKLGIVEVDRVEVEALCQQIINDNPAVVADIRSGNAKAIGSLIGQARKLNSNVNPNEVRQSLLELLKTP